MGQKGMDKLFKQKIYKKTQGICIFCGKKLSSDGLDWSVEHFFPRAIYKWIPNPEVSKVLESLSNLFIVHIPCNISKDSRLPNLKNIHALHANDDIKANLHALYIHIESAIKDYHNLKNNQWLTQQKCCGFCQKPVKLVRTTLRRKHNDLPRSAENAICLCYRCSMKANNPAYKVAMATKLNF